MKGATARRRQAFTPLHSARKSDEVYDQLLRLVRAGRYPPGSRLPSERDLAAQIHASRQTVREALYRAELAGLIEVRHGTGSFVVDATPHEPLDTSLAALVEKEADRIAEFFEIRRLVEGWCVAQAARQARAADLAAMREKLDRMKALELTDPGWEQNDVEFHVAIARATRNPMAVRMIEILRETFGALYRLRRVANHLESKPLIWKHHWAIYDAIRRRSPEAATKAIVAHMDYVEGKLDASVRKIKS